MVKPVDSFSEMETHSQAFSSSSSSPATMESVSPQDNGQDDDDEIEIIDIVSLNNGDDGDNGERRLSSRTPSSGWHSSAEEEEADSDECKLLEQVEKAQKSLSAKMTKLSKCLKRRKRRQLKSRRDKRRAAARVTNGGGGGGQASGQLVEGVSVPSSSKETEQRLKSKLAMVTAELSRSRGEQVRKVRKAAGGAREEMVIEIPDFPMEYYDEKIVMISHIWKLDHWYPHFNRCLEARKKEPEYAQWIQTRVNDFFPEVLRIVCNVWNKTAKPRSRITGSDLIKCRLVSKSWKTSIDQFLRQHSLDYDVNDEDNMGVTVCTRICSTNCMQFSNRVLVSVAASNKENAAHPFPSRHLELNARPLKTVELTKLFKSTMEMRLLVYGAELQSFNFFGYPDPVPDKHNFNGVSSVLISGWPTVREWLETMKELRRLEISLPFSADAISTGVPSVSTWHRVTDPFPPMPKLTTVEFCHVPGKLVDSMLSANKQVKKLQVFQISGQSHPNWTSHSHLPQLVEFSMNALRLDHVQPLQTVQWPLRKLALSSSGVIEEPLDIGKLFKILEKFQDTLTDLSLSLRVACSPPGNEDLSLRLPLLRNLDLSLLERSTEDDQKVSYDFLLPLIKLESLKIDLERESCRDDVENGKVVQVIQIRGYLNRLYDSNIWTLFPGLRKVATVAAYGEDSAAKELHYSRHVFSIKK